MSGFYSYDNSRASTNKDEPVFKGLFRTSWVLPNPLKNIFGTELIIQNVKKVGGLDMEKLPELVEQNHTHVLRSYVGVAAELKWDLEFEFEVNVDSVTKVAYPHNIFRAWSKIQYDINNGFTAPKKDYTGAVIIDFHDKEGTILRKVEFPTIFISEPITPWDGEYKSNEIQTLTVKMRGENPRDRTIQQ